MNRLRGHSAVFLLAVATLCALLAGGVLSAQGNAEIFCRGEMLCAPDNLVFLWDENGDSVLRLDGAAREVEATVFIDARSKRLSGWSYGLRHDPYALSLLGSALRVCSISSLKPFS